MRTSFILPIVAATFFIGTHSMNFAYATPSDTVLEGCEGEGCGCTNEVKTNKDFILYEKMDLSSKVLGKFKSGIEAKAGKASTKIVKKGKSKVIEVKDLTLGLKVSDEVNTIFYLGEGFYKVKLGEKWIEFEDEKVKLKQIEAPKYESWLEMDVGKFHGYSPTFPFMGCLE